jgi:hypothetical protein
MMTRNLTPLALCLAALGLTACEPRREVAGNPKICVNFNAGKTTPLPAGSDAAAGAVEDCVRRWAYSLAPSRDDAGTVANAVAAACNPQLARWNQQTLAQPGAEGEAASIITGQPTTPLAEHNNFTVSRALFYVVQARAGACAAPPAANGAPEGLTS